jgi:flagellar biosynthetic protein FlhB
MSDDKDDSQKTEQPTQKRLQEAEEKGDVAQSADIAAWLVLAAATGFIAMWAGTTASGLRQMMTGFLSQPHTLSLDRDTMSGLMQGVGTQLLLILSVPLGLLLVVGVGSHLIQHKPVFAWEKLKPEFSRISPLKGFGKLFGRVALMNFAKGLLKTVVASVAIGVTLWPARDQLLGLITMPVAGLLPLVQDLTVQILIAALAVLGIIALADIGWQYFERMRRLRMTRQEVRDEHKQSEGDPAVKARIRQIRSERARKRMMANVPKAAVIITNPTHYAVALAYESGKMGAPICVAKGVDDIALKIREIGKEHNIPIVENPPLARALYASVDVDESIKAEHFTAVAQVIGFVMRLKMKASSARTERRK